MREKSISVTLGGHTSNPRGGMYFPTLYQIRKSLKKLCIWCIFNHSILTVGYAKNQAVEQSSGVYLCFQDIVSLTKICLFYEQYKIIPVCVVLFVLIQSIVIDYRHCSIIWRMMWCHQTECLNSIRPLDQSRTV